MSKSVMEEIALLSEEEQRVALEGLDMDALVWDWSMWGRPEQRPPDDDSWAVGLFMAGRGAGKTRSAAEWIRSKARISNQGKLRFLLVARTAADVREVLVEGDSGILSVSPPSEMPEYRPSIRRVEWPNGNVAFCTSADEPDSLRGVQAHYSWGDEVAAWRQTPDGAGMTAWDNLRVATRLGPNPQVLATTTPKRVDTLFKLIEESKTNKRIWMSSGSTFDNAGNLSADYLDGLLGVYDGTPQSVQELYGQMLEAIEGALWTQEMINEAHFFSLPPYTPLRVVAVDPSVAENPKDFCGIVVMGSTAERDLYKRHAWVMEDASLQGPPEEWAREVVRVARAYSAPVVAEVNQGGALVANAIHQIDPTIKVLEVHAQVGKRLRAEPVTLPYHQKRVHHVGDGRLADLEAQMVGWEPENPKSPDRLDALVHGLTALLIKPPQGMVGGGIAGRSVADRRINLPRLSQRAAASRSRGGSIRRGV